MWDCNDIKGLNVTSVKDYLNQTFSMIRVGNLLVDAA